MERAECPRRDGETWVGLALATPQRVVTDKEGDDSEEWQCGCTENGVLGIGRGSMENAAPVGEDCLQRMFSSPDLPRNGTRQLVRVRGVLYQAV